MTAQLSREIVENILQHNDESDSPANAEAWEVNALCRLALAGMDSKPVLFEKQVCEFVTNNYSKYQEAFLCGKCAEIVCYLLGMNGVDAQKMTTKVDGVGHLLVKSGNYFIDPSIKQFGDYPEFSEGTYPINGVIFQPSLKPATVAVPECFVRFHQGIKERHYGRMPEEVQEVKEGATMLKGDKQ